MFAMGIFLVTPPALPHQQPSPARPHFIHERAVMLTNLFSSVRRILGLSAGEDRRRYRRHKRCTLLTLQELDDDLSAIGQTKWAMSRDVNDHGIGFVAAEPIASNYIRVTIVEDKSSAIGQIRHSRPLPGAEESWFVGVEYLDDDVCHER